MQFSESDIANPTKQQEVLVYFQTLTNNEVGWKNCLQEIVSGKIPDNEPQRCYLNLQVIEQYLKKRYSSADITEQSAIKELMAACLNRTSTSGGTYPKFLKRKMAQIFALTFIVDFPNRWLNFFQEVFANLTIDAIIEFYLRTLLEIDSEISDREIQRTKEESERNTLIKDRMRETCVPTLVDSWARILGNSTSHPILCLCLNVIGEFVSWIDISLIANERFVPVIVQYLQNPLTQESAGDSICSILNKGMDPSLKVELVKAMDTVLLQSGVYNVDDKTPLSKITKVAELIDCLGTVLIDCYNKTVKAGQIKTANEKIMPLIQGKLQPMLSCFCHDDNEVSGSVSEFAHQYIVLLKSVTPLSDSHRAFVKDLLLGVLKKYRFPDDYDHDKEGEDEAEFQEFRKEIRIIFMNIGMLDNQLVMDTAEQLVTTTLTNWRSLNFVDCNLACSILYFLGETLPANQGAHFASNDAKAVTLKTLLKLLVTSGVSEGMHQSVVLEYFESVCRYDKFYATQPDLLPDIVKSFLDQRGLHHASGKVRSRVSYLFSRFVKLQKTSIMHFVPEILSHMGDLLAISPGRSSERLITPEDQFFLFEATGTLIVVGNYTPEEKRMYMEQLLGSLVTKFNEGLELLKSITDDTQRAEIIEFLNHVMAYASRTTKAFSNQMSMKACDCSDLFLQLMGTFMNAVSLENATLLDGLRQYLHRMVICLEGELLPRLDLVIERFLVIAPNDMKYLQDFLILIQQITSKFKEESVPYMRNQIGAIYRTVWDVLSKNHDLEDELVARDLMYLRRAYFQFLAVIVSNKSVDLWTCSGNDVLQRILESLSVGAIQVDDPLAQRQCFSIMHKLVDSAKLKPEHALWIDVFLVENATAACFQGPFRVNFDFEDAQCVHVINEIATCLRKFMEYKGQDFERFLREKCLPELGLSPQATQELLLALKSSEGKAFQRYLKVRQRSMF